MELTKEQKIEALKYALKRVIIKKQKKHSASLCFIISDGIDYVICGYSDIASVHLYIPEFQRPKETLNYKSTYWWPPFDFNSRIQYLENLIKQIENQ